MQIVCTLGAPARSRRRHLDLLPFLIWTPLSLTSHRRSTSRPHTSTQHISPHVHYLPMVPTESFRPGIRPNAQVFKSHHGESRFLSRNLLLQRDQCTSFRNRIQSPEFFSRILLSYQPGVGYVGVLLYACSWWRRHLHPISREVVEVLLPTYPPSRPTDTLFPPRRLGRQ